MSTVVNENPVKLKLDVFKRSTSIKKKRKGKSSSVKSPKIRKSSSCSSDNQFNSPLAKWQSEQNLNHARIVAAAKGGSGTSTPERRRSSSLCRITGASASLDEPHYFPSRADFPYFGRRSSCHITYAHDVNGDNFTFPLPDPRPGKPAKEKPGRPTEWNYGVLNGQTEPRRSIVPPPSNDLSENPSQLLKHRFKQKNWASSEDEPEGGRRKSKSGSKEKDRDSVHRSKSLKHNKRKSSLVTCNLSSNKTSKSDESIDINNNILQDNNNVQAAVHNDTVALDSQTSDTISKNEVHSFTGTSFKLFLHSTLAFMRATLSVSNEFLLWQGQVYEAILDYKPPRSATDEICLMEGQEVVVLGKDKPHKWVAIVYLVYQIANFQCKPLLALTTQMASTH